MFGTSWLPWGFARWRQGRPRPVRPPSARGRSTRFTLEQLESRTVLSSYSAATVSDLIADINAANNAGGTNTITLAAPTTSPYVLTDVDNSTDGPTGLPVISGGTKKVAADSLTIVGNGDTIERSTVSGTPDFRLFDVASGASLTLENLTLENGLALGSASSADGGAVYNQDTLTLMGVTAQNNIAEGSTGASGTNGSPSGGAGASAEGGAIWSDGTLTLENLMLSNGTVLATTIQNNQAVGGAGGAAVAGSKNYRDAVLGGLGGDGVGGGVYVLGGSTTVTNAFLSANTAQGGQGGSGSQAYAGGTGADGIGGGLFAAYPTVTVSGTTVVSNVAQAGAGGAGGTGSTGNTTPLAGYGGNGGFAFGGGMDLPGGTSVAPVVLSSDTVDSNQAVGGAGGSGSTAGAGGLADGGGLYLVGSSTAPTTITVSSTTVDSNTVQDGPGNLSGQGAGIYIEDAAVTLCNDTVELNTGVQGGGIFIAIPTIDSVFIDSFTLANTILNTDHSGLNGPTANIDGPYILQNC
jgi:hypothetical protein